jgi:hypothetical protein
MTVAGQQHRRAQQVPAALGKQPLQVTAVLRITHATHLLLVSTYQYEEGAADVDALSPCAVGVARHGSTGGVEWFDGRRASGS